MRARSYGPAHAWRSVLSAAGALKPPRLFRRELASSLARATGCEATVASCGRGAPIGARFDSSTAELDSLGAGLSRFLPRLEAHGEGWRQLVERHGCVFPTVDAVSAPRIVEAVRRQVLARYDVRGLLTTMVRDADGQVLGWVVLAARTRSSDVLLRELRPALDDVAQTLGRTLDAALALAEEHGARWDIPTDNPDNLDIARLSKREREIAELVAAGYSDLNIAAHLDIGESTVGTHLYRIYKRLGIHSRVELAARLAASAAPPRRR